jgi:hypothetical protein
MNMDILQPPTMTFEFWGCRLSVPSIADTVDGIKTSMSSSCCNYCAAPDASVGLAVRNRAAFQRKPNHEYYYVIISS